MSIEQKKISLINWITNLNDELVLDQIVDLQKTTLSDLPESIIKILEMADSESEDDLIPHSSSKAFIQ